MVEDRPVRREVLHFDVLIIGAGPAGLSAGLRLRKLCLKHGQELSVCIIENGPAVGAHILSGAVFDPIALNELIPDWKARGAPLLIPVGQDEFFILTPRGRIRIPHALLPPLMNNRGNFVVSLGNRCRWLASYAAHRPTQPQDCTHARIGASG